MFQYATLEDTVYLWFGANNTSGTGDDGASAVYDVREGGAATNAIPTLSGNADLLTHANYPAGAYEIAIAATAGNGFAANKSYGVFCTLLVDSQNPTGYVGGFRLAPVPSNVTAMATGVVTANALATDAATEIKTAIFAEPVLTEDYVADSFGAAMQEIHADIGGGGGGGGSVIE
jgi:hypothetical protein